MLFGNGAVGGIVNTSSKLPDPDAPNIVQLDFGSHDLFQAGIDTGGTLDREGRLRYRVVALGRTAKTQVEHTRDDARALMPSLSFSPDEKTTLNRYRVALTGRNLADKVYLTSCSAYDCFFGETRTIGLSLTAQF